MNGSVQQKLHPAGDRDSAPYWEGIRRHQLLLQHCGNCGTMRWPASPICKKCLSRNANWEPVSGTGKVASWIVVQRAPNPAFESAVPYAVVLVSPTDEPDLLVIGHVPRPHVPSLKRGLPVHTVFRDVDGATELEWHPISGPAPASAAQ